MLTYNLTDRGHRVLLEKKYIGNIKTVAGGYRYVPKGHRDEQGGEIFTSLDDCKKSLECDD